ATDPGTRAAKEASAKIPIVIVSVNYDPVELGYINNLARPGTNVTGVLFLHRELTAKRVELFREILPTVKRVSVLSDPLGADQLTALKAANRSMGLKLQVLDLGNPSYDFESSFRVAMRSGGGTLRADYPGHLSRARKNRAARPEEPAPNELRASRARRRRRAHVIWAELRGHVAACCRLRGQDPKGC